MFIFLLEEGREGIHYFIQFMHPVSFFPYRQIKQHIGRTAYNDKAISPKMLGYEAEHYNSTNGPEFVHDNDLHKSCKPNQDALPIIDAT